MEGVLVFTTENSVAKLGKGGSNLTGVCNWYSLGRNGKREEKTQYGSGGQKMPAEIRMRTQSSVTRTGT